jgi:hypothetical protein
MLGATQSMVTCLWIQTAPWTGRRLDWFVLMKHILHLPEPIWRLNEANQCPVESCLYSLSNASKSTEMNVYVMWRPLRTNATGVDGRKGA